MQLVTGISTKQLLSGNVLLKYKNVRKWMIEFLRKFENRGIEEIPYENCPEFEKCFKLFFLNRHKYNKSDVLGII